MSVLLRHSDNLPAETEFDFWFAVTGSAADLAPESNWPDVAIRLEAAYDGCAETCWEIGLALAKEPGSELARTPTMGAYGTDFRLMVAWVMLSVELVKAQERYLLVCDAPWLFREIASRQDVAAGPAPSLALAKLKLRVRGLLSRTRNAIRLMVTNLRLCRQRRVPTVGRPALMVYGHPGRKPDGMDAYFGDLMRREPDLQRILHSDCPAGMARSLSSPRTASIHAWGNPLFAL